MARSIVIVFFVVVLVVAAGWAVYHRISANPSNPTPSPTLSPTGSASPSVTPTPGPVQTLEGGVQAQDLVVGDGEEATNGSTVTVDYIGWLAEEDPNNPGTVVPGTKFDSSIDRGQPFQFTLGTGSVIKGWDVGVAGMRVGGVRILLIPPSMGYGAAGAGNVIPPNAALLFQVQLLKVE